jgi:hypothetical protein
MMAEFMDAVMEILEEYDEDVRMKITAKLFAKK